MKEDIISSIFFFVVVLVDILKLVSSQYRGIISGCSFFFFCFLSIFFKI